MRTELRSGKVEIPIDYRLHVNDGTWQAYDLILDGISLVKNYRSQFDKIIRFDSYEELVRRLRDRTVVEEKQERRQGTSPTFMTPLRLPAGYFMHLTQPRSVLGAEPLLLD